MIKLLLTFMLDNFIMFYGFNSFCMLITYIFYFNRIKQNKIFLLVLLFLVILLDIVYGNINFLIYILLILFLYFKSEYRLLFSVIIFIIYPVLYWLFLVVIFGYSFNLSSLFDCVIYLVIPTLVYYDLFLFGSCILKRQ